MQAVWWLGEEWGSGSKLVGDDDEGFRICQEATGIDQHHHSIEFVWKCLCNEYRNLGEALVLGMSTKHT